MSAFPAGLLLGLALILPIGAQNLFVLNQALLVGMPRVLAVTVTASLCDTLLIGLGAGGVASVLHAAPGLSGALTAVGVVFLVTLGLRSLYARAPGAEPTAVHRGSALVGPTLAVSLLNPHAILDTVAILGGAIAAQGAGQRSGFALGVISASWLWFQGLGLAGALARARLPATTRLWMQRGSGLVMLLFALLLVVHLVSSLC